MLCWEKWGLLTGLRQHRRNWIVWASLIVLMCYKNRSFVCCTVTLTGCYCFLWQNYCNCAVSFVCCYRAGGTATQQLLLRQTCRESVCDAKSLNRKKLMTFKFADRTLSFDYVLFVKNRPIALFFLPWIFCAPNYSDFFDVFSMGLVLSATRGVPLRFAITKKGKATNWDLWAQTRIVVIEKRRKLDLPQLWI